MSRHAPGMAAGAVAGLQGAANGKHGAASGRGNASANLILGALVQDGFGRSAHGCH
jgi:hypothetical protein